MPPLPFATTHTPARFIVFRLILGVCFCFISSESFGATHTPNPPTLLKSNANWWVQSRRPHPLQGWDSLAYNLKAQSHNVQQAVDDKGTLIFLLHMSVDKKGKVSFAEVWDGNSNDTWVKLALINAIKSSTFTPYVNAKGKRLKESTLVLMEIPGSKQQNTTQPQDTVIPNQAITPARFLGGQNAFFEFVADQFIYPPRCVDELLNGYVRLRFMVDRDGTVSNCRIKESSNACPEFGLEAIRVLRSCPKWIPATHSGKNISAWFEVPISLSVR